MPSRCRLGTTLALGLALVFVVVTTAITWLEHETFNSTSLDMAVYSQLVWNTAGGQPFETSLLLQNRLHLAEHLALLLLPIAPLYGLLPDPRLLLLLQQVALGLSGLAIFWLARRTLSTGPALTLTAGYYAMPTLTEVALDAFYPIAFAAIPVGWSLALAVGRYRVTPALLLLLALLFEEEAALVALGVGAYLLLFRSRARRAGLTAALAGLLWLGLGETVVMPAYLQPGPEASATRVDLHFGELRERPLEWMLTVAANRLEPELFRSTGWLESRGLPEDCPAAVGHCSALRWWLYPTGGLALLSPTTLVAAAPTAGALLLADRPGRFRRHWAAPMLPVIWIAAAQGLARLARWRAGVQAGTLGLLLASLLMYRLDSSLPLGNQFEPSDVVWTRGARELQQSGRLIPAEASLAAGRRGLAHYANRRLLFALPPDSYSPALWPPDVWPEYVLIDLERDEDEPPRWLRPDPRAENRPAYAEVARNRGSLLLRRADFEG